MTDGYVSIPCIEHERLEFAVLKRQKLNLRYLDESGVVHTALVMPTDVATRNQAEWLSYRTETGNEDVVRLDRIVLALPL